MEVSEKHVKPVDAVMEEMEARGTGFMDLVKFLLCLFCEGVTFHAGRCLGVTRFLSTLVSLIFSTFSMCFGK